MRTSRHANTGYDVLDRRLYAFSWILAAVAVTASASFSTHTTTASTIASYHSVVCSTMRRRSSSSKSLPHLLPRGLQLPPSFSRQRHQQRQSLPPLIHNAIAPKQSVWPVLQFVARQSSDRFVRSTTTTADNDHSHHHRKGRIRTLRWTRLPFLTTTTCFLLFLLVLLCSTTSAMAATTITTTIASSAAAAATTTLDPSSWRRFSMLGYSRQLYRHRRHIVRSILLVGLVWTGWENYTMRQRLAQDATSEWSRYAKHPLARARAASHWLLVQLLPLLLRIRFVQYLVDRKSPQQQQKQQQRTLELQKRAGQVFANGLLKLGPLYIKIGQILSCRDKLLPDPWKTAMERLQDQVPAQSGVQAQQLAYASWPGGRESFHQTFTDTNWTPLAAASLGQVHQAVLRENGDMVALKLQRPYLRDIYNRDLALMTKIARTVDKYFGSSAGSMGGVSQSWTEIFADAEEILYREIDYRAEAENAVRFARDFGLAKGGQAAIASTRARDGELLPSAAPWLRTPYVYQHLSTEQVLVMELVSSIKISAKEKLDQANVTAADREYLADCLGRSYLRQFCCNKFFSTDPHAGNLGVELLDMNSTIPEQRVRLVYYDFGQAAELQQNQADGILDIIEAIVVMDVDKSVESFQKMQVLKEGADLGVVRAKVADNYKTGKIKANRKKLKMRGYELKEIASEATVNKTKALQNATVVTTSGNVTDAQVMQYFTLPAEYAFVGRALSQMDGVGKSLDSDFDFVSSAAPWIYEIKGARRYLKEEFVKRLTNLRNQICEILSRSLQWDTIVHSSAREQVLSNATLDSSC